MLELKTTNELDQNIGKVFWCWRCYFGKYTYKIQNFLPIREVILIKESFDRYLLVDNFFRDTIYRTIWLRNGTLLSKVVLYETKEDAIEGWNSVINDNLDKLRSEFDQKSRYLQGKLLNINH